MGTGCLVLVDRLVLSQRDSLYVTIVHYTMTEHKTNELHNMSQFARPFLPVVEERYTLRLLEHTNHRGLHYFSILGCIGVPC